MNQPQPDRPRKVRSGARVIVRCDDKVLLLADRDPGVPGVQWWVLPGGGRDPHEPSRLAAVRELAEETGLELQPEVLQGPVAHRLAVHGYSDRVLVQDEELWLVDVDECFEVRGQQLTEGELSRGMGQWRWFSRDELSGVTVWPEALGDLMGWDGDAVVELGAVEESTIPV